MRQRPFDIDASTARDQAYAWLETQFSLLEASSPDPLVRVLDWLTAAWICEQGFGVGVGAVTTPLSSIGARAVSWRLDNKGMPQAFGELFDCNLLRVVLARGILKCCGVPCAVLDAFINGVAESLANGAEGTRPGDSDLLEARLLLGLTGLGPEPTRPALDDDLGSALDLLQADEARIHRVVSHIAAASAYGTAETTVKPAAREMLCAVIGVWLLDFARGYKLDHVALLARTLAYLGAMHDAPIREALDFLVAQQHPTGRFGFFGPEAARAHATSPGFNESVELHLPMTLACLWVLAECRGGEFRLLASVQPR